MAEKRTFSINRFRHQLEISPNPFCPLLGYYQHNLLNAYASLFIFPDKGSLINPTYIYEQNNHCSADQQFKQLCQNSLSLSPTYNIKVIDIPNYTIVQSAPTQHDADQNNFKKIYGEKQQREVAFNALFISYEPFQTSISEHTHYLEYCFPINIHPTIIR